MEEGRPGRAAAPGPRDGPALLQALGHLVASQAKPEEAVRDPPLRLVGEAAALVGHLAEARVEAATATLGPFEPGDGRELHVEALEELADLLNYTLPFHQASHPGPALDVARALVMRRLGELALAIGELARLTERAGRRRR